MTPPDWLARFDRDGAIAESDERALTRAQLLGAAGGVAVGLAASAGSAVARSSAAQDDAILNYALSLEYLQAAFYSEAERAGALDGALAHQARVVGAHERAHVAAFRRVLGSAAIARPHFDFQGVTEQPKAFRETAVAFEDLAVAAYQERMPLIAHHDYLAAAVAIHSVEARHAAWIRRLAQVLPATEAFDEPLPPRRVEALVASTGFIGRRARTAGRGDPRFTG